LSEPANSAVDSAWAPWVSQATGTLEVEVPGTIEKTNAPTRNGNVLSYPLAYGQTVEVEVSYKQMQWVAVVSVILVAIFLLYLAFAGLRAMQGRKKPPAPAATA
jgi:hypothetical protein